MKKARKVLYRGLGCVAVALGFIGAIVPGIPTTIFVLAASYCFARSSPRLEGWLLAHRWFGPPLRRFRETGGMTMPAKMAAIGAMWTATLISAVTLAAASKKAGRQTARVQLTVSGVHWNRVIDTKGGIQSEARRA